MPARFHYPRICVSLGFPSAEQMLACARQEAAEGSTFFEFRLDYLDDPEQGVAAISDFVREYPECRALATCRREAGHGRYRGDVEGQLRLLTEALKAGASGVDVEIESAGRGAVRKLEEIRRLGDLIVSYHHFEATPAMEAVYRRLTRVPAKAYKIAVTARKPSDILRLVNVARNHRRTPLILVAMGETGFPGRVIAPVFGGLFTYAAPAASAGTAPGQASAHTLRHLYHIDSLSRTTKIYGVIADPVAHSISPAVHNRAFHALRVDAVYVPFRVAPTQLRDFFTVAERLPVRGFSVTIPHKQRVLRYLDHVDPLARRIGAVNTVWRKAGKWRGTNTDAPAVTGPLEKRLRLAGASVLIAGSGGGARAAAFAVADRGAKVWITGRSPDKVRKLATLCRATPLPREEAAQGDFDVLVHATPLGMHPDTEACFFNGRIPAGVVFDMVYNPAETLLLRRAREQGKTVISGLEMFVEQAVRQFEIWTGCEAPAGVMERAAREALESR